MAVEKGEPQTDAALASANVRTNLDGLFEGDFEPLRVRAQGTPDMTVQVEDDNSRSYVDGNIPLDFAGGNSPTFTAPAGASEKQIDILTLNSSGTLAITSGTPTTGTPVPPTYPTDKMVLAEIYLRNGMSSIKNTDDATNGYIFKVRSPLFNLGGAGKIVQIVNIQDGVYATTTTQIPSDNTKPQNTEGGEFMTLAITPTNASNILEITIVFNAEGSTNAEVTAALFQDSTADALACASTYTSTNETQNIVFKHRMTAGTTSATTFKLRAGIDTGGTLHFNGEGSAAAYGGVLASSITIKEIEV